MINLGFSLVVSEGLPDISENDLYKHICVVGGTGKGKTTFLLNLIRQIQGTKIILDPNGSLAERAFPLNQEAQYITKEKPISLNPLTRNYLSHSENSNELAEVLNTATKVTNQEQTAPTVLMARLIRNALRVGINDLKQLSDFFDFEEERRKINDKFWRNFDATDRKGWYINRESRESAKRISSRLSLLTDDQHLYPFVKGKNAFDISNLKTNYIFNLGRFDDFLVAFLGGLIATYVKSYYLHQATEQSLPLFFIIDEVHLFFSDLFSRFLAECRKYNIGVIMSLHSYSQVDNKFVDMIEANCYTKVLLQENFKAKITIGDTTHQVLCDPPPKISAVEFPVYYFLRNDFFVV